MVLAIGQWGLENMFEDEPEMRDAVARIIYEQIPESRPILEEAGLCRYGAPEQIEPKGLGDYLEVMSKAVFQSGMSWKVINGKWPGIHEAFRGFEPLAVASLTEAEMADLAADTRIIRNRKKVEAIVDNARQMIELDEAHDGCSATTCARTAASRGPWRTCARTSASWASSAASTSSTS